MRLHTYAFFIKPHNVHLSLGYQVAGEGNLIPSKWIYLGEKVISREDSLVFVPCEYFSDRYWRFCFHLVTFTIVGTTETLTKLCLPAKDKGNYATLPFGKFRIVFKVISYDEMATLTTKSLNE